MQPLTLIYDGACGFCVGWVEWVKKRDKKGIFIYLTCQSQERANQFPDIQETECLEAMYLVTPEGQKFAGADALPKIFKELPGWKVVGLLLSLPGISIITWPVYGVIAKNRYRFGCDSHTCSIK